MMRKVILFILILNYSVGFAQKNREKFISVKRHYDKFVDTPVNEEVILHIDTDIPGGKQIGDTLVGEQVKYKFSYYNNGGYVYLSMQNIENRDAANLTGNYPKRMIQDWYVPESVKRQFAEIVGEFLTPEERAVYRGVVFCDKIQEVNDLIVYCRLKQGKIAELSFVFGSMRAKDVAEMSRIDSLVRVAKAEKSQVNVSFGEAYAEKTEMLRKIPADRYYAMERALIERMDFSGEEWMKGGKYFRVVISSNRM